MSEPAITADRDTDLETAARTMLDRGIGALVVVDARGEVVGILTESDFAAKKAHIPFSTFALPRVLGQWLGKDCVERIYQAARTMKVGDIMSHPVHVVEECDPIEKVLELMLDRDIKHVPVVRARRPVGLVARHDLLRLLSRKQNDAR